METPTHPANFVIYCDHLFNINSFCEVFYRLLELPTDVNQILHLDIGKNCNLSEHGLVIHSGGMHEEERNLQDIVQAG